MFAAGRVAPALRGRQSCRTNDRSRPTARRTSSGRARGSRASNKPCPRASLLHRVPNKRNRVDARAFGREWFLESWSSGRVRGCVHREVILKVRRTIFPHDITVHALLGSLIVSHLDQSCFLGRSSAGSPAGSGRTTPATWSTPRRGACSVPRDHPTPAPDSPARRRAAEVKMVGYIRQLLTVCSTAARARSGAVHDSCLLPLSQLACTPFRRIHKLTSSQLRSLGVPADLITGRHIVGYWAQSHRSGLELQHHSATIE